MTDNRQQLSEAAEAAILEVESGEGWANEDLMQSKYFSWAINKHPQLKYLLFHVPNGGNRNAREAMKLKAMGVTAGIPDLLLISPAKGALIGIELKLPRGTVQLDQTKCHKAWDDQRILVYIVRNFSQFKGIIENACYVHPF